ncbi:uncharacterized protein VP01_6256g2 [Puccinia sorghi]|uniref:HAT C-terminal dimerisation domain-containing protein n=1 Tax=Puccinia sorghi TaxID=27349 RepID=A0A0L6UIJ7_9BASI|nr:uncharacterized protein VP01_6256g2 [Puccinia sorghi]
MALPIYMSLIKNIYQIRFTYDSTQLILVADQMIAKLKKYLVYFYPLDAALWSLKFEVRSLNCSPSKMQHLATSKKKIRKKTRPYQSLKPIYLVKPQSPTISNAGIDQYIAELNEKPSKNIITYWSQHKKVYPSLSLMAQSYLGIPATSAPLERVFS